MPTVIAAISTAAAYKQVPTGILGGFTVVRGGLGRMEIKISSIASLHPFSLFLILCHEMHHFITNTRVHDTSLLLFSASHHFITTTRHFSSLL
jgi:hypothetical protein